MKIRLLQLLSIPVLTLAVLSCDGRGNGNSDRQTEPVILSITTDYDGKAMAGRPVTIHGSHFSPVASDNKVVCGTGQDAVALRVDEASEEQLVFTAPKVSEPQLSIRVSVKGKESNSVVLEYVVEKPWDDTPTITFPEATTVTVCPGVVWTSYHGVWEGWTRNINIVRTTLNGHNRLGIYYNYSHNGLDDLDQKCEYLDAVAGTNGPMACCQFVRVDGEVMRAPTDEDYWIANCAITIDDGVVDIVKVNDNYAAKRLPNKTVGCAGPLLVWEGEIQTYPEDATEGFLMSTHPRTAIGLSKDGKTVTQVTVDGRWYKEGWPAEQTAIGMSTALLSKLMRGLGCYKAMNFDGGGGTAMWVYGHGNSRSIVNHVSENLWDWNGTTLRPTGNAVYIKSNLK
jgi:hypothetical protein